MYLKQFLAAPLGVAPAQSELEDVMETHEDSVQRGEAWLLVHSNVACVATATTQ